MIVENLLKDIRKMKWILDQSTPRERKIFKLRWGFSFNKTRTLEEVGQKFGITKERVRQIESKTLEKIINEFENLK